MAEEFGLSPDLEGSDDASMFDIFADILGKDNNNSSDKMLWDATLNDADISVDASARQNSGGKQSKKRKVNPDAETIAAVTEEALKELDLDPDSQDAKKKRRQIRNRLSAQFHRDRKNAYIKTLEETVEQKNLEIAKLQQTIAALKTENDILKQASMVIGHNRTDSLGSYSSYTDGESVGSHSPGPADSPLIGAIKIESHVPNLPPLGAGIDKQGRLFSAPIFKSLAVLSVLCIICVSTISPGTLQSGSLSTNPKVVMEAPFSPPVHGRRLLEDSSASTPTTTTTLTILPPNHAVVNQSLPFFSKSSSDVSNTTVQVQRTYLRRSQPQDEPSHHVFNHTESNHHHHPAQQLIASKDLIPFLYHPHHHSLPDWYFQSQSSAFPSLSYSQIVLNNGLALFDPALQLVQGHHEYEAMFHPSYSLVPKTSPEMIITTPPAPPSPTATATTSAASAATTGDAVSGEQSTALTTYHGHGHGPTAVYTPEHVMEMDNRVDNKQDKKELFPVQEKHWPALTTPNAFQAHHPSPPVDPSSTSTCEREKQELISKLLSSSNLITVSLPASAVRLGKTFTDSRVGTMEGLMQMFNLTSSNTDGTTIYPTSLAEATIEMDCILLNAKLVMSDGASNTK